MASTILGKPFYFNGGYSMLLSTALIFIVSITLALLFEKIRIPGLVAMMITGIVLGPYVLYLIDARILALSLDLRQIALIVILLRAGLSLDLKDLKKIGRPALLLSFVPATLEIIVITIFAPMLFGMTYLDAAILGTVLAAVSPAVIVPRMIKMMESGLGKDKSVPQLIMAGASIDDIFVIVLFYSLANTSSGQSFNPLALLNVPISIILGTTLGVLSGISFVALFKKIHVRDTIKVLIMFGISFLFVVLEDVTKGFVPFSGLIGVIAFGITILKLYPVLAKRMLSKFGKIWVFAEIVLFVLVGAAVDITVVGTVGLLAIALIGIGLVGRSFGVLASLVKTKLNKKEKAFVTMSYIPKATVQAAIGSIPLALGIASGHTILAIAVLAIFITAPLGALLIDLTNKKLLKQVELRQE